MTDNLWEEVAYWQHYDEDRILEIIDAQELQQASELEAAIQFTREIEMRKNK